MRFASWLLLLFLVSCSTSRNSSVSSYPRINSLRFLGEYQLPHGYLFDSTEVGGLSGIDYNPEREEYYLVSDDPSTKGPARFYTAGIRISDTGIVALSINKVTALRDGKGDAYTDIRTNRMGSADVESIRYDRRRKELAWSTEGQRIVREDYTELQDPAIVRMGLDGSFHDSLPLPGNIHISRDGKGPRHNSGFEGLAFDETYDHLYVSLEDALYDDGQRAGTGDSTAWIRILKYDLQKKLPVAQFAYELDPVPHAATPPGAFKINGVAEIMFAGMDRLLVLERAWSTGRAQSDVRIYLADLSKAEDVSAISSLRDGRLRKPVRKTLVADLNSLGIFIDNIEGLCLGPRLPNGNRSLLVVVDNNFDPRQRNQILLFEIR